MKNCYNLLNKKGFVFIVVFSDKESSYGKGKEFEPNTFESKLGRPVHYFTEEDLIDHLKDFRIINLGQIEEKEKHGILGSHTHSLRYIFAQKK